MAITISAAKDRAGYNRAYYLTHTKQKKGCGDKRGRPALETPRTKEELRDAVNKRYAAKRKHVNPLCRIDRELCKLAEQHQVDVTPDVYDAIIRFAATMFVGRKVADAAISKL